MPRSKSPLAGKTVKIKTGELAGLEIIIEDWWENVHGATWRFSAEVPAVMFYAARRTRDHHLPLDDDVLYGKIGNFGYLVHISELGDKDDA